MDDYFPFQLINFFLKVYTKWNILTNIHLFILDGMDPMSPLKHYLNKQNNLG
jgi:hypothetical protein